MFDAGSMHASGEELPDCEKCPFVNVPGGDSKPFLRAADQALSDGAAGGNPLNMSETKMCPPEIRYVGMKQHGFEAEYRVFYGLQSSQIPMYVFHGLTPVKANEEMAESHGLKTLKANEEMADFIIVTDKLVAALEVKAFSTDSKEAFRKILHKSFDQLERLRKNVKMFLEDHNCKVSDDEELPLATFSLFPLAERDRLLAYIEEKDRDRVLFGDEYIEKLKDIIKLDIVDKTKRQHQLRILLAWFYGTYSYEELGVRKIIDGKKGKTQEQVGGVFLSKGQLEIIQCKNKYLGIIGFPGTGKTFCLVAKLVRDITEKLKKENNEKIGDGNRKRDEKILFIHQLKSTLEYIENLFWSALKQRKFSEGDVRKVKGIVEFWTVKDFDSMCKSLAESDYQLKVFFDDSNTRLSSILLINLATKIDFLWYTSYSFIQFSHPRFLPNYIVDGDHIYDTRKYAFLDKTVRFTAHIHSLAETIYTKMPETHDTAMFNGGNDHGPYKTPSYRYACGTRVIGDKVEFVRVTDTVLLDETVLKELRKQLEKFEPKSILVIHGLDVMTENERVRSFRGFLKSNHDEIFKDVTVADYRSVRGQEKECVIVVCDHSIAVTDLQKIIDASTRAISKLVLVYLGEMLEIPEDTEGRIPTVSAGKSQDSVLKEVEKLSITQLLEGDARIFQEFVINLFISSQLLFTNIIPQKSFSTEQEKQSKLDAFYAELDLSCTDTILNKIVKDPSESFLCLKKACYFQLLIIKINGCKDCMLDSEHGLDVSEKFQKKINQLLGDLLEWMKNIEEEPGIKTGVFSSSFIQYRQVVRTFRHSLTTDTYFHSELEKIVQVPWYETRWGKNAEHFKNRPETQETRTLWLEIEKLCSVYEKATGLE